jgi:choline-sulfatase
VHVHGHDERLFDLDADPGEWDDLLGRPEVAEIERELRDAIHAEFEVERLAEIGPASVPRRELVARAMARNGTHWDYQPFVDATTQYVR